MSANSSSDGPDRKRRRTVAGSSVNSQEPDSQSHEKQAIHLIVQGLKAFANNNNFSIPELTGRSGPQDITQDEIKKMAENIGLKSEELNDIAINTGVNLQNISFADDIKCRSCEVLVGVQGVQDKKKRVAEEMHYISKNAY